MATSPKATETKETTTPADVKADIALFGSLKTEKDRNAAIDKMEIGASDATLYRRFAVLMWAIGKASTGNAPPAATEYLKAFNSKMRGGTTGRPIVKEDSSTFTSMASVYGSFATLGFQKSYPSDSVLVWVLDNVKGPYSTRGKFLKELAKLTEEPDADKLSELWAASQQKPKLANKATATTKSIKGLAGEEEFKPTLRDNAGVRAAYAKLVNAAAAFEAAVKAGTSEDGDDDLLAEIMREAA